MDREADIGKWTVVFFLSLLVGMLNPRVNAQVVSITPPETCVTVGDTVEVSLFADADILGLKGTFIKTSFDSTVLSVVDVSEGSLLPSGGSTFWSWEMVGSDTVETDEALLGPGLYVDGPGTLAVISFEAIGPGESRVVLTSTDLRDSLNYNLPHTAADGKVCVTAVGPGVDVGPGPDTVGTEGDDVPVVFNILNLGNIGDTYDIMVTDNQGWTLNPSAFSVSLTPCCTGTTLSIMASVPPGALASTVDEIKLKAISQADPSVRDSNWVTVTVIDTLPPAPITDLSARTATSSSVILSWTSPGDDGNEGTASVYAIRYSLEQVGVDTNSWWDAASMVSGGPSPSPPGGRDSCEVSGLSPSTIYYFLIRTADELPNWSGFSNVACETTCAVGIGGKGELNGLPGSFKLFQNYPNPFNPITEIRYLLPDVSHVKLEIYNLLGRRIITLVDEYQEAGSRVVRWDGRDGGGNKVESGVYFYRLEAGRYKSTKKMVLLR